MILCFSGTGNSRYIAKKIAVELQDEIVDVNAKIKAVDYSPIKTGENVVVVTPTYAWRIPRIVSDWLSKTKLLSAKRIWFVMNCGSEIGNASKYNRSLAEQKHFFAVDTMFMSASSIKRKSTLWLREVARSFIFRSATTFPGRKHLRENVLLCFRFEMLIRK